MAAAMWWGLAVKLAASAGVVVLASLIAELVGPLGAAMIASLPVSAGPAFVLLAMEGDGSFLATAAHGSLAVLPATALFLVVYALSARAGLAVSIMLSLSVWAGAALLLREIDLGVGPSLFLNTASFLTGAFVTRRRFKAPVTAAARRQWWDVPFRSIVVAALVGAVLLVGHTLGPAAAGATAAFPLTMTSLIVIVHPRLGHRVSVAMMANALPGMVGFGAALALVALETASLGKAGALLVGLGIGVIWNLGLLTRALLLQRHYGAC